MSACNEGLVTHIHSAPCWNAADPVRRLDVI